MSPVGDKAVEEELDDGCSEAVDGEDLVPEGAVEEEDCSPSDLVPFDAAVLEEALEAPNAVLFVRVVSGVELLHLRTERQAVR